MIIGLISVQLQLNLPTGTELGNINKSAQSEEVAIDEFIRYFESLQKLVRFVACVTSYGADMFGWSGRASVDTKNQEVWLKMFFLSLFRQRWHSARWGTCAC